MVQTLTARFARGTGGWDEGEDEEEGAGEKKGEAGEGGRPQGANCGPDSAGVLKRKSGAEGGAPARLRP